MGKKAQQRSGVHGRRKVSSCAPLVKDIVKSGVMEFPLVVVMEGTAQFVCQNIVLVSVWLVI